MQLAIVSDAWEPQVNGVVTTLQHTIQCIEGGVNVEVVHPGCGFATMPCPSYPSIRLAMFPWRGVARNLDRIQPDAIHISTEGPLGMAARQYCVARGLKFTTSYHTQYPRYLRSRWPIPESITYAFLRHFHSAAAATMVATASMRRELEAHGFRNLTEWGRGVDTGLFRPQAKGFLGLPRPILMYVGRLAVEKNLDAFLNLEVAGTKVIVGEGPAERALKVRYPQAVFTGLLRREALARHLADADVFVFPSRTDTFGVVMLEAMACGVPVAAFPVAGPIDVVQDGRTGMLREDLAEAVRLAAALDGEVCREFAATRTWHAAAQQFAGNLVAARGNALAPLPSTFRPAGPFVTN